MEMQIVLTPENIGGFTAALAAGVVTFLLSFRKLISFMTKEKKDTAALNGEIEVINLLREQISDLAKANKELRVEIQALRDLNHDLILENESFKEEIRALKRYIEAHFQEKG
jgi:FtsZ-binding cell division protein ZapB